MAKTLKIGNRVEGGKSGTEDYDRGRVMSVDARAKIANVAWDSNVITVATFDSLDVIGAKGPKGKYPSRDDSPKKHGITFGDWLEAAGRSDSASDHDLRAAWSAGEDPEDYE